MQDFLLHIVDTVRVAMPLLLCLSLPPFLSALCSSAPYNPDLGLLDLRDLLTAFCAGCAATPWLMGSFTALGCAKAFAAGTGVSGLTTAFTAVGPCSSLLASRCKASAVACTMRARQLRLQYVAGQTEHCTSIIC